MKSIIFQTIFALILINQHVVLSRPNLWYHRHLNNLPNPYMIYFRDDYGNIIMKPEDIDQSILQYGPTLPERGNHVNNPDQPKDAVEVANRANFFSPSFCPKGTVNYYGKCKPKNSNHGR